MGRYCSGLPLHPRFGYQDSSPLHKPCGNVVGITLFQHIPHSLPKKYCGLTEMLPPVSTYAVSSRGFPAVKFLNNLPSDSTINRFHIFWHWFIRHPASPVDQIRVLGIPLPITLFQNSETASADGCWMPSVPLPKPFCRHETPCLFAGMERHVCGWRS